MKITVATDEFKTRPEMVIAFDVSKATLDYYALTINEQFCATGSVSNRTSSIDTELEKFEKLASQTGSVDLLVVCEPTGGLERKLLHCARKRGLKTKYVNAESVKKMKVVINNDTGKTDAIDSYVIHEVAKKWKTLQVIERDGDYGTLNALSALFEAESRRCADLKNSIHAVIRQLFCDYSKNAKFTFNPSGLALMELYGFSPYKIVAAGYDSFFKTMKAHNKYFKAKTILDLWDDALSSVNHQQPEELTEALADQITHLYQQYSSMVQRKTGLEHKMCEVYSRLEESEKLKDFTDVNTFFKARIVAETGPLRNFSNAKKLIRFAGLNLIEKDSGTVTGSKRISKKGRSSLRKILYQIVFTLIRKNGLMHEYYKSKGGKDSGTRVMVACMRKMLFAILGVYQSEQAYDAERVFTSQSQYLISDPAA